MLVGVFDAGSARVVGEAHHATEASNSPPNSRPSATPSAPGRELGLPTGWSESVQAGLDRAVREGYAAGDPARLIEHVRPDALQFT